MLGISPDRVNKIVNGAMRKLGVSRRSTAARMLAEQEPLPPTSGLTHSLGDQPLGVASSSPVLPDRSADMPIGMQRDQDRDIPNGPPAHSDSAGGNLASIPLPLRGNGRRNNDLSGRSTLIAISLIALAAAGTAGAGASLLLVLNWLVTGR